MPRNWTRASWFAGLLVLTIQAIPAQAVDPSETLLPDTTKGFISITNMDQLSEHWDKTELGQLSKDPVMKPFADDLRRQITERLFDLRRRLGITLDDLTGVPGGEVAVAFLQPAEGETAVILLIDVTGHQDKAQGLLEKAAKNMAEQKAKRTTAEISGTPATVFELPKAEGAAADARLEQTIYVLKDDLLIAADHAAAIKAVLDRVAGGRGKTLADVPAFRATIDRCQKDAGDQKPQIRWFIEPFGYSAAVRAATPEKERKRGRPLMEQLQLAGFNAVQGIGGFVDLAVDGYQAVHRTSVYAPKPYEKSMKMLVLPNVDPEQPPAWIPRGVASYRVIRCDLLGAFDNFGPLFDQVVGEGARGVWEDSLEGLRTQKDGPMIDLREELFKHLDDEILLVTDCKTPVTTTSERLLYAIKVKDAEAVAKAITKTQSANKDVRKREFEGKTIWETIPPPKAKVKAVELAAPPLGFEEEEEGTRTEKPPLLPNMAVTVDHGYLLVASHYDFLLRMLGPVDEREALGRSIDYRFVEAVLNRLSPGAVCVHGFSRTDEEYRSTYELLRQGKLPESENVLARVLNSFLAPSQQGTARKQEIDASKAPDYDLVRRYLGPGGMFAVSEEDGWFFKGVLLSKETE